MVDAAYFDVPDPDLGAFFRAADDHVAIVGTPRDVTDAARVVLVGLVERELAGDGIHVPDDHAAVLGAAGEVPAVVGELAEPDLVAVVVQHLQSGARKLVPFEE